ncbi:MAG: tRNA dihydrouridine(20/20a) synthase DusA [Proteobacteria bacterium]|nr:tRNA dihydrouridine(20/20a) synthase DusA [Pseudomonadota bacterium]
MQHTFAVAPMLAWTDKHCRYLHRLISADVLLYSEMITTPAILQGDTKKHLSFNPQEHPVVLQLGGSNADDLARSCKIAQDFGYDEVNLNLGCPSDRVQQGRFGACLMHEPDLVVSCVQAMIAAVDIPITIKCRIGVDNNDSFANLYNFINQCADAGVTTIIIHARKALLKGLSPKQNRSIPALNYAYVYRIKQLFPELTIVINGGITTVQAALQHLQQVDGIMLGRAIWNNPWLLFDLQHAILKSASNNTRDKVLQKYSEYCQTQIANGVKLHWLLPPVLNLYHGLTGNKKWKSYLVTQAPKRAGDVNVFQEAREFIEL